MLSRGFVHSDFSFTFEVRASSLLLTHSSCSPTEIVAENESKQLDSVAHQLQNARNVTNVVRSQFDKKSTALEHSCETDSNKDVELDVQVRVEHSVTVDYPSHVYAEESYRMPNHVVWDP